MNPNEEAARLYKTRTQLRQVAKDASASLDWQTQLSALGRIVAMAPTLWPLMRTRRLKPKGEEAVRVLARAYAVFLDDHRLGELERIVESIPELKELYSSEIADCKKDIVLHRQLYSSILENPGVAQSSLGSPHLIYLAACYGIVKRDRKGSTYALTFQGVPEFQPSATLTGVDRYPDALKMIPA